MTRVRTKQALIAGFAAFLMAFPALASINRSVSVPDGGSSDGASSVNGSITIGEDATVTGDLQTVNGSIRVGAGSRIEDASTVNGTIRIASNVHSEDLETVNGAIKVADQVVVDGGITAVNGSISLDEGSSTAQGLSNVNGGITLTASTVDGDVSTVNGDISVMEGAVISGDLTVEKPGGWRWNNSDRNKPEIVIGPGSRVEGTIILEREVDLYISETASVGGVEGVMSMDDAVRFSGSRP